MPTITFYSHWADRAEYAEATGRVTPTWTGEVPVGELFEILASFNRVTADDHARLRDLGYYLPSLSVGDVIVLDSDTPSPSHHFVAVVGFVELDPDEYAAIRASPNPFVAAEEFAMASC